MLELHEENSKTRLNFNKSQLISRINKLETSLSPEKSPLKSREMTSYIENREDYEELVDLYTNEKKIAWQLEVKNKRLESEYNELKQSIKKSNKSPMLYVNQI